MVSTNPLSLIPSKLLNKGGEVDDSSVKSASVVAIYFSAHWCPPCRGFTPLLAEAYEEWIKEKKSVEVVFVSSDRSDEEYKSYLATMPWVSVPHSDTSSVNALKTHFKVSGIPTLIVLDKNGNIVDANARSTVTKNPTGAPDAWIK